MMTNSHVFSIQNDTDFITYPPPIWADVIPTSAGTLMVEEDAVTGKHVVGLAVVDDYPIPIQLGSTWRGEYHGMTLNIKTLRSRQNGHHLPDDIFKSIFLNENVWIAIKISLKFVPEGPINNIPALVQIMTWCHSGNKPLFKPMVVSLLMHICVTQPQRVHDWVFFFFKIWFFSHIIPFHCNISVWHWSNIRNV